MLINIFKKTLALVKKKFFFSLYPGLLAPVECFQSDITKTFLNVNLEGIGPKALGVGNNGQVPSGPHWRSLADICGFLYEAHQRGGAMMTPYGHGKQNFIGELFAPVYVKGADLPK